jgi:hypothetical protein
MERAKERGREIAKEGGGERERGRRKSQGMRVPPLK